MSGGAVIIRRQNSLMRRFADAGATDPGRAFTLDELGCRDSWVFRRMAAQGVFHRHDGRWWMDPDGAERFRTDRVVRGLTVVGLLAVIAVVAWLSIENWTG